MSLMVSNGGELIRFNPANGHIEYSTSQGRTWYARYSSSNIGNVKAMVDGGKELILCSDRGVFYSTSYGRSWYTRNVSYKNFIDMSVSGGELLAFTYDGHLYYSTNKGGSWYRRR